MKTFDDFDRVLAGWFETDALPPAPAGLLAEVSAATARRRPRPGWYADLRGHWVDNLDQVSGRGTQRTHRVATEPAAGPAHGPARWCRGAGGQPASHAETERHRPAGPRGVHDGRHDGGDPRPPRRRGAAGWSCAGRRWRQRPDQPARIRGALGPHHLDVQLGRSDEPCTLRSDSDAPPGWPGARRGR